LTDWLKEGVAKEMRSNKIKKGMPYIRKIDRGLSTGTKLVILILGRIR
jgi:hypothetical protein